MAVSAFTQTSSANAGGLLTDGNALVSVDQTTLAESNYELLRDGTRRRRRPIYEETADRSGFRPVPNNAPISAHIWENPGHDTDTLIAVEQVGHLIEFYKLDRDTPSYVRNDPYPSGIDLRLWQFQYGFAPDTRCTYTEGNGNLYIFNEFTGCIRVTYDPVADDFTFAPIGTWIRDYEGAIEDQPADERVEGVNPLAWAVAQTFEAPLTGDNIAIADEMTDARAYNLSNSGWDAQSVSEFRKQSDQDYVTVDPARVYVADGVDPTINDVGIVGLRTYTVTNPPMFPAYTDRWILGRQVDEKTGQDIFSFPQLIKARENKSLPALGARVRDAYSGVSGTLNPIPFDLAGQWTVTPSAASHVIRLFFPTRQFHANPGWGASSFRVFLHSFVFSYEQGGRKWFGGLSGTHQAFPEGNGFVLRFVRPDFGVSAGEGHTNYALEEVIAYPSPEYFPHAAIANGNGVNRPAGGGLSPAGEFAGGRLWQCHPHSKRVTYSQIVPDGGRQTDGNGVNWESQCFIKNDPTDPEVNQLLLTDGGYLSVPDSGEHYGLEKLGDNLLLITSTGVWIIGNVGGIDPSGFVVKRLSHAEALGPTAIVNVGSEVHVAATEGILRFSMGDGGVSVDNLVEKRIRNLYDSLIDENFRSDLYLTDVDPNIDMGRRPFGAYDSETRTIRWSFVRKGNPLISSFDGNVFLSYAMTQDAWYRYDTPGQTSIQAMFALPFTVESESYNRFRYLVTTPNTDVLAIPEPMLCQWGVEVDFDENGDGTWVEPIDLTERFADFREIGDPQVRDGTPAFMLSNHQVLGEGQRWAQVNYITTICRKVASDYIDDGDGSVSESVPGSTLLSVRWDWTDNENWGKYAPEQEVHRKRRSFIPSGPGPIDHGEPRLVAKTKVPGRGREFRVHIRANGHADSHIEGWAVDGTVLRAV